MNSVKEIKQNSTFWMNSININEIIDLSAKKEKFFRKMYVDKQL